MYNPTGYKIPERQPISLGEVVDMAEKYKFDLMGYIVKDMTCDPFGKAVLACSDTKTGFVLCYDCHEQQALRRIGAGNHNVDSVTFDKENNFVFSVDNGKMRKIVMHKLTGEKITEFILEDVQKVYCLTCYHENIIASVTLADNKQVVRIYNYSGEINDTFELDKSGKPLFGKATHCIVTGDTLAVGDVSDRNIKAFNLNDTSERKSILWTYAIDVPRGMTVDGAGNLCVCDFRNNRLLLLTPEGKMVGHALTTLHKPQFVHILNNKLYTLDGGRSTCLRVTVTTLHKTLVRRKSKPNWVGPTEKPKN